MKKKIGIIIGVVVISVVLAAMLVFVFTGKEPATTGGTPSLEGTWRVATYTTGGVTSFVEQEYVVIDDTTLSDYRDDLTTPYASGAYTLSGEKLIVKDLSLEYQIEIVTDNILRLHETTDTYMQLYRHPNTDLSPATFDTATFTGKWDVLVHGGTPVTGETISIEGDTLQIFSAGSSDAAVTTAFNWSGDVLSLEDVGMEMATFASLDGSLIMVNKADGYIWEMKPAN